MRNEVLPFHEVVAAQLDDAVEASILSGQDSPGATVVAGQANVPPSLIQVGKPDDESTALTRQPA